MTPIVAIVFAILTRHSKQNYYSVIHRTDTQCQIFLVFKPAINFWLMFKEVLPGCFLRKFLTKCNKMSYLADKGVTFPSF